MAAALADNAASHLRTCRLAVTPTNLAGNFSTPAAWRVPSPSNFQMTVAIRSREAEWWPSSRTAIHRCH